MRCYRVDALTVGHTVSMTEGLLPDPATLAMMSPDQIRALLDTVPDTHLATLASATEPALMGDKVDLLPHQLPPEDGWDGWVLMGGRGCGKTFTSAFFLGDLAAKTPGLRGRIIAPTLSDAVNSVVNDPQSGILAHFPKAVLKTHGPEGTRLVFPNKSTLWCVGTPTTKDVDRLRALTNIDVDLFEEAAANPNLEAAVEQANLSRRGTRLPKPLWIASTTPRPVVQIKEWKKESEDVLGKGEIIVLRHARLQDNPHTPAAYHRHAERLKGTRIYRQEILGEILEDVEGALWTQANLDRSRRKIDWRDLVQVVVGVDPPSGAGTCGIIVVGKDAEGQIYVLADYSIEDAQPGEWAQRVVQASDDFGGALVIAEVNQGGRMVSAVMKVQKSNLPITTVRAAEGKKTRAEPIAILWEAEQQVGFLAEQECALDAGLDLALFCDQAIEWVPGIGDSPDRIDAMVWASTYLLGDAIKQWKVVGTIINGRGRTKSGTEVNRAGKVAWGR
jgi:phage terminase large subunit-like protein